MQSASLCKNGKTGQNLIWGKHLGAKEHFVFVLDGDPGVISHSERKGELEENSAPCRLPRISKMAEVGDLIFGVHNDG